MKPEQLTARALPKVVDGLLATAIVLALLYFGRDILVPVTLAFMLSFLIAPFVRTLREVGLGPTASVCSGVVIVTVALGAVAAVLVSQVAHLGANLSQHPEPIAHKLTVLDDLTRGALGNLGGSAGQLVDHFVQNGAASSGAAGNGAASRGAAGTPLLVEIQAPALKPFQLLSKIAATAWVPVETAGIVFVVLIFILLEHESLRDRFIRLAGGGDLRATTLAVNDAGERLSRFFISQFLVNLTTGLVIWLGLSLAGLGQPLLWGAMTAVLRFVPYVGVWMAALCATLLAAATDPGGSMALTTLGLFLSVEVIVAQTIEPKL
jgi:predicted PurR-regulated permease PerM